MSKNELPPIQAWFVNRQVPFGDAPKHIKKQWVDVPLPLRQIQPGEGPDLHIGHNVDTTYGITDVHIVEDGMAVYVFDAVKALTLFGREEAACFWNDMLDPDQALLFDGTEGQLYPTPVLQRILPGIEFFDQTEV